jgi:hypothetical protein
MEDEIAGKIANNFATVVKREPGMHVMKVKWVITIALNNDGSIKKVKARLVGCGYSQKAKVDYMYAYSILASLSMGPTATHLNAVMHMVGYLVATQELGLTYGGKLRVPLGLSDMPPWFEVREALLWGNVRGRRSLDL